MSVEVVVVGIAVIVAVISVTSAIIGIWQKVGSKKNAENEITVIKNFDSIQIYGLTTQELEKINHDIEEMKLNRLNTATSGKI